MRQGVQLGDELIAVNYRGVPTLVKDPHGREKCVSCQLCEFVCPPKAIRITPGEIADDAFSRRFFGIWLSPKTSQPGMRETMLQQVRATAAQGKP